MDEEKVCCICGKTFVGFGNNAYPVVDDGICCDECNSLYVIPSRIDSMYKKKTVTEIEELKHNATEKLLDCIRKYGKRIARYDRNDDGNIDDTDTIFIYEYDQIIYYIQMKRGEYVTYFKGGNII